MDALRIGIVGIGNMGSAHAACIAEGKIEGLALGAVCDINPLRLDWAQAHAPQAARFDSWEQMVQSGSVDAVLIATPHYLHPEVAVGAFAHGLHVLTEKPAGVYTAQVEAMNEAAKASGKVFGIMYNQRTHPPYRKVRELVRGGKLGALKRLSWTITNWYRTQAYYDSGAWRATWSGEGGGVLMNQCPHNLDIWQWIFGMPKRVRGMCRYGQWHHIEVEDEATIYAEYENGASAVFIASTGECPGTNRLEIAGDRGKLVLENGKLRLWELDTPERELCFQSRECYVSPAAAVSDIEAPGEDTAHAGILQNFTDAVLHGAALIAPGEEGILGLSIANAAYLSDWTGEWCTLPVDAERFRQMLDERCAASGQKARGAAGGAPSGEYSARWQVNYR